MTPSDWAEIFDAGASAISSKFEPAVNTLALALTAMAVKAREIAVRTQREWQWDPGTQIVWAREYVEDTYGPGTPKEPEL